MDEVYSLGSYKKIVLHVPFDGVPKNYEAPKS
jgi:hypothetical protein